VNSPLKPPKTIGGRFLSFFSFRHNIINFMETIFMKKYMKVIFLKDCKIELLNNDVIDDCKNLFMTRKNNSIILYEIYDSNCFRAIDIIPQRIYYKDKHYKPFIFWRLKVLPTEIIEYEKNKFKKF